MPILNGNNIPYFMRINKKNCNIDLKHYNDGVNIICCLKKLYYVTNKV